MLSRPFSGAVAENVSSAGPSASECTRYFHQTLKNFFSGIPTQERAFPLGSASYHRCAPFTGRQVSLEELLLAGSERRFWDFDPGCRFSQALTGFPIPRPRRFKNTPWNFIQPKSIVYAPISHRCTPLLPLHGMNRFNDLYPLIFLGVKRQVKPQGRGQNNGKKVADHEQKSQDTKVVKKQNATQRAKRSLTTISMAFEKFR